MLASEHSLQQQKRLESQLVNNYAFDILVAKYALISVEYRSLEEALELIYGNDDF